MTRTLPSIAAFLWMLLAFPLAAFAEKPNILVILTDDQSYETLRAAGHTDIDTPHLDRLSSRGTTFTHAYNSGSWSPAVCIASRAMLITGRSLWHAEKASKQLDSKNSPLPSWPRLMADAGYSTHFTGKWHVPADVSAHFHHSANIRGGMPKDTAAAYNRPHADQADTWNPTDPAQGGFWHGGKHWSEVTADDAISFIQSAADSPAQPFFILAAFNAPHDPRQSPQAYLDQYPLDRIALPASFLPAYPHKDAIGCSPQLRDEKLGPFPRTELAVKTHRREYYALISHLDAQIGRILDALDASGKTASTCILFTSDHGLAVGHHGFFGKQNLYEHSLRVPCIIAGPGIPENKRVANPVLLQDIMPTALDLAGIAKPPHVDFQSLLPLARGDASATPREAIYAAYLDLQRAIIHDGWKLIVYPKAKVVRLYDLTSDPQELKDLAPDPDFAQRIADLTALLKTHQTSQNDPHPLPDFQHPSAQ